MMLSAELLSEPAVVQDTYASGLSHVEDIGDGMWRLVFYSRQQSVYGGEEYVVVSRLICTTQSMLIGIKTAMEAIGQRCCGDAKRLGPMH